jgi:beta-lactamase regulating signal transducer with metallopeptidase domain
VPERILIINKKEIMKNQRLNHILLWVIAFLLGIANSSCSTKKQTTESDKQEIKIENSQNSENSENSETNVKVDIETKVDDKTKTVSTKKTYAPVDATKPASVTDPEGKKHELNNASITEETTTEEKDLKTDNSDNSEKFHKKATAGKAVSKGKVAAEIVAEKEDLDKSGFNFWSWLWVIGVIIIGIGLIYLNNRFKWVGRVTAFFTK